MWGLLGKCTVGNVCVATVVSGDDARSVVLETSVVPSVAVCTVATSGFSVVVGGGAVELDGAGVLARVVS